MMSSRRAALACLLAFTILLVAVPAVAQPTGDETPIWKRKYIPGPVRWATDPTERRHPGRIEIELSNDDLTTNLFLEAYAAARPANPVLQLDVNGHPLPPIVPTRELGFVILDYTYLHSGNNIITIGSGEEIEWARLRVSAIPNIDSIAGCKHFFYPLWKEPPPVDAISNDSLSLEELLNGVPSARYLDADGIGATPLQRKFDALHYDLDVKFLGSNAQINPGGPIEGISTMKARVIDGPLSSIQMDTNLGVLAVTLRRLPDGVAASTTWLLGTGQDLGTILIDADAPLETGDEFEVGVTYLGTPVMSGNDSWTEDNITINSLTEPFGPRNWFPSKDWPEDKAIFTLKYRVPNGLIGVGNGDLVSTVVDAPIGYTLFQFENDYPMPTYLVAANVGNFIRGEQFHDLIDGGGTIMIENYRRPNQNVPAAWLQVGQMISNLSPVLGPYPFPLDGYGHITCAPPSGMEHQSMTTLAISRSGYHTVVHELAHQWFGNQITCGRWQDIWLNEGFATYVEALEEEAQFGYEAYLAYTDNWAIWAPPTLVPPANTTNPSQLFSPNRIYWGGAMMLHMLRSKIGDEAFLTGFHSYANDPRFVHGNAVTEDFLRVMDKHTDFPVELWMMPRLMGSFPDLRYGWDHYEDNGTHYLALDTIQRQSGTIANYELLEFTVTFDNSETQVISVTSSQLGVPQDLFLEMPRPIVDVTMVADPWIFNGGRLASAYPRLRESLVLAPSQIGVPFQVDLGFSGGSTASPTVTVTPDFGTGLPEGLSVSMPSLGTVRIAGTPAGPDGVYTFTINLTSGTGANLLATTSVPMSILVGNSTGLTSGQIVR